MSASHIFDIAHTSPPCITLHEGKFDAGGVILVTVMRT
ncbi:hypothetical protein SAMN05518861_11658 [Mesorhizobium sp. YR577]|nr:hypothetical protein SAMN05518861_11658 [Mesorhizobium sp. YR577]